MRAETEWVLMDRIRDSVNSGKADAQTHYYCALERAIPPGESMNLVDVGASIGLTEFECYGVMDGWDQATGKKGSYNCLKLAANEWTRHDGYAANTPEKVSQYGAGHELGTRAYELFVDLKASQEG